MHKQSVVNLLVAQNLLFGLGIGLFMARSPSPLKFVFVFFGVLLWIGGRSHVKTLISGR